MVLELRHLRSDEVEGEQSNWSIVEKPKGLQAQHMSLITQPAYLMACENVIAVLFDIFGPRYGATAWRFGGRQARGAE